MTATTTNSRPTLGGWTAVCEMSDLTCDTGACVLVGGDQVAVFRTRDFGVFAISNSDPFSGTNVLSRGIVGNHGDHVTVASPMYKQRFDLESGECLDDPDIRLPAYEVQVRRGVVLIRPKHGHGEPRWRVPTALAGT